MGDGVILLRLTEVPRAKFPAAVIPVTVPVADADTGEALIGVTKRCPVGIPILTPAIAAAVTLARGKYVV